MKWDQCWIIEVDPSEWGPSGTRKQTNIGPVCASATHLLCMGNNGAHTGHAKFAVFTLGTGSLSLLTYYGT